MTCQPTTLKVQRGYRYTPTEADIDKLCELAYMAVNYHLKPTPGKYFNFRRDLVAIWSRGPECLKLKTRMRPVAFARGLVMHHLQFRLGRGCVPVARTFGYTHDVALYWKETIKDVLSLKYDSDEKEAAIMFERLVGQRRRALCSFLLFAATSGVMTQNLLLCVCAFPTLKILKFKTINYAKRD